MQRTLTLPAGLARSRPRLRLPLPSPLGLIAIGVVAVALLPLAYLTLRALGAGQAGLAYLLDGRTLAVIGNSLLLTGAVVAAALLIGLPFAWLTARTDLPLRRLWLVAGLLTLVIPSYIGAMAYIEAFGPRGALRNLLGVEALPPLYGFFGAWLAVTLFTYPYVVLPVRAALLNTDPALEEAAHSLGLSRRAVFTRVILPQLRPALAAGALLSALYTLSDFGAVALMRFDAFTRVIYLQYTSSFDRSRAAVLALALVALTIGLVLLTQRLTARQRGYRVGTGVSRQPRVVRLGRWTLPALLFCAVLVGIGSVTPVLVLVGWTLRGGAALRSLEPALNTVGVSALAALVVALAALPLAWLARADGRLGRTLCNLSFLGNGLPGLVVALALVFFAANALPALYQTLPLLVVGYGVRFLPLSVSATRSALTQINPRVEEAGRSLGLNPARVLLRITAPLARAGVLAGAALVFLSAMKELPTTLLLSPTGFNTFAMQIWTGYKEVDFAAIGAPALLLVITSALALALLLRRES